jgi:TRAP-type uncharacterized transport system substrate-binding protein
MYGNTFGLATRADKISRQDGFQIAKVLFEDTKRVKTAYPALPDNLVELTLKYSSIPLHAGVVDYLKQKGVNVPANLIPPEAK